MRPDGTRVKEASTIVSALPYVMPRRYDAQNFITEYADMEVLRRYIQEKRREGVRIPYMTLILAAYFKAYQENPKINRFIMNSKIYQRNHFCVSFVILKTRADGRADETSIKVFFEDGDDIFSINRKIEEAVAQNQVAAHNNNTDKFANFLFAIPILPGLLFGLVKLMDRCGVFCSDPAEVGTIVHVAVDGAYAGCIRIADEMKPEAKGSVAALRENGIRKTVMLTGDTEKIGEAVARELGIDEVHAELLPDGKVKALESVKTAAPGELLLYAGDGMNDAPVLAMADVGVAMGGLGSDAAIEAADVVIMDDNPKKIPAAMRIAFELSNG